MDCDAVFDDFVYGRADTSNDGLKALCVSLGKFSVVWVFVQVPARSVMGT